MATTHQQGWYAVSSRHIAVARRSRHASPAASRNSSATQQRKGTFNPSVSHTNPLYGGEEAAVPQNLRDVVDKVIENKAEELIAKTLHAKTNDIILVMVERLKQEMMALEETKKGKKTPTDKKANTTMKRWPHAKKWLSEAVSSRWTRVMNSSKKGLVKALTPVKNQLDTLITRLDASST